MSSYNYIKIHKINVHLSVGLKRLGSTAILINNKEVLLCKYLLLQFDPKKVHLYDKIDSIDEIKESYSKDLEFDKSIESFNITPEEEFWGHCSNLQAWVDNDYDTRILHSNIAFSLLKKLAKAGDKKAEDCFEKEILKRFQSLYYPTQVYIARYNLLNSTSLSFVKSLENYAHSEDILERLKLIYKRMEKRIQFNKQGKRISTHTHYTTMLRDVTFTKTHLNVKLLRCFSYSQLKDIEDCLLSDAKEKNLDIEILKNKTYKIFYRVLNEKYNLEKKHKTLSNWL